MVSARNIDRVYPSDVTRTQHPTDFNKRVGANVRQYRLARGMSQADLAAQLTVRDFPFHQQAILKVEKGTRPLKVEEVSAISDIFGIGMGALLQSDDEEARQTLSRMLQHVNRLEMEIDELNRQLVSKTRMLEGARQALQVSRDNLAASNG
jgi:transcriptional regulator with XRE-family HTH domain